MTADRDKIDLGKFDPCVICGSQSWTISRCGPVRDGKFGSSVANAIMAACTGCGAERLDEGSCRDQDIYTAQTYRRLLGESASAAGFFAEHDALQLRNLEVLWPDSVCDKVVADVGCAAGSFLDHISGLAKRIIAIEPCVEYHDSLSERGYEVFSCTSDALASCEGSVDMAFSFSTIEHVTDPRVFLSEIRALLSSEGKLLMSTPNRGDVLLELLPEDYSRFFYRTVHRWYFDTSSLAICAEKARFDVAQTRCHHRFGLSNALGWLRDRCPPGNTQMAVLDNALVDTFWRRYLEAEDRGDYLYATLVPRV